MSLTLRKTCQKYLDAARLTEYHVRIDEYTNCMQIVGSCGEPLFTISGIRFSRKSPSVDEVTYSAELLQEFLLTHKKEIENLFKTKKALQNTKVVRDSKNIKLFSYSKDYCGTYTDFDNNQTLHYAFNLDKYKIKQDEYSDVTTLASLARNKKIQKELKTAVEAYAIYHAALAVYNAAKAAAQSCNI